MRNNQPSDFRDVNGGSSGATSDSKHQQLVQKSARYKKASYEVSRYYESFERMHAVWKTRRSLPWDEWLALLGECWSTCDNHYVFHSRLRRVLGTAGRLRPMMCPDENIVYDALPGVVTVYRGCQEANILGMSWTLDRDLANHYTRLNRYKVSDPLLVTATVLKRKILALKFDRQEAEVITLSPVLVKIEKAVHDPQWMADYNRRQQQTLVAFNERAAAKHLESKTPPIPTP